MSRVAFTTVAAHPAAHPFAPRVVRLRVLKGAKGRRLIDSTDPDALLERMVLVAVDRFEAARRFHELARRQAEASRPPERAAVWTALVAQARSDAAEMESALAYLVDETFNLLAPAALRITPQQEAERDRTAPYRHRYIARGFEVEGAAYVLLDDPGNIRPGIVARIVADRASTL